MNFVLLARVAGLHLKIQEREMLEKDFNAIIDVCRNLPNVNSYDKVCNKVVLSADVMTKIPTRDEILVNAKNERNMFYIG
jgi:Asp-tRNA(Asn)/Glu-tRNA(Gln) amidotransferase C subunit